jgi:hypothetical protein
MTQFDEKLTQIHGEGFREGRVVRRGPSALALDVLFRLSRLGRRRR